MYHSACVEPTSEISKYDRLAETFLLLIMADCHLIILRETYIVAAVKRLA